MNNNLTKHPLDKAISISRATAAVILLFGFASGLIIGFFGIPLNIAYGAPYSGYLPYKIALGIGILSMVAYPIIQKIKYSQIKSNIYHLGKIQVHIILLSLIAGGAGFVFSIWIYTILFTKNPSNISINEFFYYQNFATKLAFIPVALSTYLKTLRKIISQSFSAREIIITVVLTIFFIITLTLISFINFNNANSYSWRDIISGLITGGSSYTFAIFFLLKFSPDQNVNN